MTASRVGISIVVRTSNAEVSLRRLLRHLPLALEDELIIVDSGSTDGTLQFAEDAGAQVIRNSEAFDYSKTLNLGFQQARNKWVLALSSHCVPVQDDLLECYRQIVARFPVTPAVIYGYQVFSHRQYARLDKTPILFKSGDGTCPPPGGANSNALYYRDVWALHPFDGSLGKTGGEDFEWRDWALNAGYSLVMAREACILYRHPGSPSYRYEKARREATLFRSKRRPMSWSEVIFAVAQATRQLLWREFEFRSWIGQLAHIAGHFAGSRAPLDKKADAD